MSCWLTWIILLKVYWPNPNPEVYGERVSWWIWPLFIKWMFYWNGKIPQWCLINLWEANHSLCYWCHDGLTVSATHLRRIRDVDMKRDYAFVVRILFLIYICIVFYQILEMAGRSDFCYMTIDFLYFVRVSSLSCLILSLTRNLVILGMRTTPNII